MPSFIRIAEQGPIARVTLARPELHNAFNDEMMAELTEAFASLGGAPEVRLIVLDAEGKSFCAGADINWMKRMVGYTIEENMADANVLAKMLRTIRECPRPTVARVHGATFGGGVGLVAACDMAVATAESMFCLSEVKLGIVPAVISPFVLEKIGAGHARRYALTAERFDGREAHRIGLVSQVVENANELDPWIEQIGASVSGNGPAAVAACKRILSRVAGQNWDDVQAYTTRQISEIRVSPEGQEGLKSFLEKRKPNW